MKKQKGYKPTTSSALGWLFTNEIGITRLWHLNELTADKNFQKHKDQFIKGLEKIIGYESIPEGKGVTREKLKELVQLAKGLDLADIKDVKKLYVSYCKIKNIPYNEAEYFDGK